MVWRYLAIPGQVSFSEDGCTWRFAGNFTAETEGGRVVVGQPLPLKRGYPSGIGTLPIPAKHDNTRAGRPIPSEHQGFGHSILLLIERGRRHQRLLAGVFVIQSPCVYQSSVFIPGEAYSHQWPRCGERFLGRYTPEERFRGRLREWCLGERDPHCCQGPGKRFPVVPPGCGMSTTIGGHSRRSKAAASGRATSMASRVSGRAARGSG